MPSSDRVFQGLIYERFAQLARPRGGQDSPAKDGLDLAGWMKLSGVGSKMRKHPMGPQDDVITMLWPCTLDTGIHEPIGQATKVMRRLIQSGLAERIPQTSRYRAVPEGRP